jgi:putative MATE family efflux protein
VNRAPVAPGILQMAAPLVVSFWMRALFTFVDTIYASTLGDASVAAIGLSLPWEFLMIAAWVGLSTGLTSNLARAMGAREETKLKQYLRASRTLVLWCIPVFAALGAGLGLFASRLSPDPQVAREFSIYGPVLIAGSAFTTFWAVIPDSIIKAHGDTRSTMWAGIWSNVVNVLLNTLFTFVFHWGIFGIGLSTVLGRLAGLAYALRKAKAHEDERRARPEPDAPGEDPRPFRSLFSLSVPATVAYVLMASETAIVTGVLAGLADGRAAIAAYAIFYRVFQFAVMPAIAAAVAMLPFAARRFGTRDVKGIAEGLRTVHLAGAAYALALAPVLWFAARPLAAALTHAEAAREYATFGLRTVPAAVLFSLPFFLVRPAFEGMGKGRPGLVVAALRYVVLTAPAVWIGVRAAEGLGRSGFEGMVVSLLATAAICSAVFLLWIQRALRVEGAVP